MQAGAVQSPLHSVRSKAALILASQATSALIAYGSLVVVGRFFDPASYGSFAYALGVTTLVLILSDLGLSYVHQRNVAMGVPIGSSLMVMVRLRSGLLMALIAFGFLVWVLAPGVTWETLTRSTTWPILGVVLAVQVVALLRSLFEMTWQAQQRIHLVEGLRFSDSVLTLFVLTNGGLLLAHLQGWAPPLVRVGGLWAQALDLTRPLDVEQGALLIAGAYLVAKSIGLCLALAWVRRDAWRPATWDNQLARTFVRLALPLSLASILGLVMTSMDVVMIGIFWDAQEVAFYGVAQRLGALCLLVGASVAALLFPRYAELHALGDKAGKDATFLAAQRYLVLLAAPLAAAMIALTPNGVVATAGPAYLPSVDALRWLAGWAFLTTLGLSIQSRVMAEGDTRFLLILTFVSAGSDFMLNALLIPPQLGGFGATGAAAATFASAAFAYAYLRRWSHRMHGTALWGFHLWRIVVAAGLTGLVWWTAGQMLPATWIDHTWELMVIGFAGLGFYATLLALLREVTSEDARIVGRLVHPRSWLPRKNGQG